jgi:hypothetical protein
MVEDPGEGGVEAIGDRALDLIVEDFPPMGPAIGRKLDLSAQKGPDIATVAVAGLARVP